MPLEETAIPAVQPGAHAGPVWHGAASALTWHGWGPARLTSQQELWEHGAGEYLGTGVQ